MNNLGLVYLDALGVPRDATRARQWFEKAAGLGNVNAMHNLGVLHSRGEGAKPDLAKALEWQEKAAAGGHVGAMADLGVRFANGVGVARDDVKAREWFERAAEKGNASAMHNLGIFYNNGRGAAEDVAKARYWFAKAATAGHEDAPGEIERLDIRRANAVGDPAEAMRLQEVRAARLEAAETKSNGKPGSETAGSQMSAAWYALFAREPARSLAWSERANGIAPGDKAIATNRAHALMQLGRLDEARAIYLTFRDGSDASGKPWKTIIAEDFAELRKAGLMHPFMAQVETALGISP